MIVFVEWNSKIKEMAIELKYILLDYLIIIIAASSLLYDSPLVFANNAFFKI